MTVRSTRWMWRWMKPVSSCWPCNNRLRGIFAFITTAMKISSDLERMSDLAENICERTIELNEEPQLKPYIDIPLMADLAIKMVGEALDAFVRGDSVTGSQGPRG